MCLQVVNSSHYSAGKLCSFCTVFQQIACFIIKGLVPKWCLSLVMLSSRCFTAHSVGCQSRAMQRFSEPGEREPSSQVVLPSVGARSIIALFTEKPFANPSNGSVQRMDLIENLLSVGVLLSQQHVNTTLSYFKGIEEGDFSGAEMRTISCVGGATNHRRLQEGGCSGFQEQQLH